MKKQVGKKKKNNVLTKEYFDKYNKDLMEYLEMRFNPTENKIEDLGKNFEFFKNSVLKSLDWLIKSFKKFDEEHTILTGTYSEINEKIGDHDKRIIVLEKKASYKTN